MLARRLLPILFSTCVLFIVLGGPATASDDDHESVTPGDVAAGQASCPRDAKPPRVVFIVNENEYHSGTTLSRFAEMLRERHGCDTVVLHGGGTHSFPHMEELETADCVVLFIRRRALPKEQLDKFRRYVAAGKPLVALRTASHAFEVRRETPPPGSDQWPEFCQDVLGGNYTNHLGNELGSDVTIVPEMADHPVLAGVTPTKWHSTGSLYRMAPVADDATVLMTGSIQDVTTPLTWIRTKHGRIFFTSLGHPDDFDDPQFVRLLVNAVFWALDRPETAESVKHNQ